MKNKSEEILKEKIPELTEKYFEIILCDSNSKSYEEKEKDRIIKAFENILPRLPVHTPRLRATNTESVLKLLRRGKLTLLEAERLMSIMATEFEITQLPELLERFESLNK